MNNSRTQFPLLQSILICSVIAGLGLSALTFPGIALAALSAQTLTATNIGDTSATLQGSVGPSASSGNISAWFEYGDTTSLGLTTSVVALSTVGGDIAQTVSNLGENRTIYFRVVAEPVGVSSERVYGTIRTFVTGESGSFSANHDFFAVLMRGTQVKSTSAVISGGVSEANVPVWVEWGTSSGFEQKSFSQSSSQPYAKLYFTITGLNASTEYYARLGATSKGVTRYSGVAKFTTRRSSTSSDDNDGSLPGEPSQAYRPSVNTRDMVAISPTSVVLQGRATNPKSGEMSLWFQWGTTQSVDRVTTPQRVSVNAYDFASTINGLTKGQRYYYRAVAQNTEGSTLGALLTFIAGEGSSPQSSMLSAATGPLSFLSDSYATVTGTVQVGARPATAYIRWGETEEMLRNTSGFTLTRTGISVPVSETLSPLNSSTRYFYQVVATEDGEVRSGVVRSFITVARPVPTDGTPPPPPLTSVDGSKTTIAFRAENLSQAPGLSEVVIANPGDQLRFAIQVTNTGTAANKNIVVSTEVPKELSITTIHNGGEQKNSTLTWEISSLAAKTSTTLQFDATAGTANADLVHTLVASVVSSITNRISNDVHVVLPRSPVTIDVVEDPSVVMRGSKVEYTFSVKNIATEDMLDTSLAVTFVDGVTVVKENDFSGGNPWKADIGSLAEGKTTKKKITVEIPANAADALVAKITFTYRFADGNVMTVSQDHTTKVTDGTSTAASRRGPSWWWWIITILLFIALVISLLSRRVSGPKEVGSDSTGIHLPTYK